ncbi:MAG: NADAR family protein [Bacteroidaceae bacterium]|nr:NADAR family protein [Bacteroidaceae bacterium]
MLYPEYDIVERYPAEQTIGFTSTTAEWGILSNFAKTPMVVNGLEFACVEQLFHYIRLNNEEERTEYLKLIPNLGLKMKAKAFEKRGIERADWKGIAVDVMRFCLNHKYQSSEEFRRALADSGSKYIVEDESNRKKKPDSWGAVLDSATNEYYGKNIMGRLLMELREKRVLEYTEFEF